MINFAPTMNNSPAIPPKLFTFYQWSRKGFALFAALRLVVKIARLPVDVCALAIKKLKSTLLDIAANLLYIEEKPDTALTDLNPVELLAYIAPSPTKSISPNKMGDNYIEFVKPKKSIVGSTKSGNGLFNYAHHDRY